jgi:hypothetical protein
VPTPSEIRDRYARGHRDFRRLDIDDPPDGGGGSSFRQAILDDRRASDRRASDRSVSRTAGRVTG